MAVVAPQESAMNSLAFATVAVATQVFAASARSEGVATPPMAGTCGRAALVHVTNATAIATVARVARIQTARCCSASPSELRSTLVRGSSMLATNESAFPGRPYGDDRRRTRLGGAMPTQVWARSPLRRARAGTTGAMVICASITWPCSASTSAHCAGAASMGSVSVTPVGGASIARFRPRRVHHLCLPSRSILAAQ